MADDLLRVFLGKDEAGGLSADTNGRMTFRYLGAGAPALSLSLPPRTEPYDDAACRPFFAGLLPEGQALQRAAEIRRLQVYQTFELLRAYGAECAGAVRLLPADQSPEIRQEYERLDDRSLLQEIRAINDAPLFARDNRVRLSAPGVQSKTAVKVTDDSIFKPLNGSPSTHLLKVGNERFPDLAKNEAFCLKLAASLGIPTAEVDLRQIDGISYLLVKRYDRAIKGGAVLELHQEDFCQALGYLPADKYEINEESGRKVGPGFAECRTLIARTRSPALDLRNFILRTIFNYLVANADAHAKNLSLLYEGDGHVTLAPLYDVVCTRLYPSLMETFAMRYGGVLDPAQMTAKAWDRLAEEVGVRPSFFRQIVRGLAIRILPATLELMSGDRGFSQFPPYSHILSTIGERVAKLSDDLSLGIEVDTPPLILRPPGWGTFS